MVKWRWQKKKRGGFFLLLFSPSDSNNGDFVFQPRASFKLLIPPNCQHSIRWQMAKSLPKSVFQQKQEEQQQLPIEDES